MEEISVSRDNDGVINGCNMGICEDDDCLKCLKKKVISIVNQLAEEYKDKEYCWQECASTEHCKECSRLGNGDIDYFESIDDWTDSLPTIDVGELLGNSEQVKQTNADRIRAMSDEELADYLYRMALCSLTTVKIDNKEIAIPKLLKCLQYEAE